MKPQLGSAATALGVLGIAIGMQSEPVLLAAPVAGMVAAAAVRFSTEKEQP